MTLAANEEGQELPLGQPIYAGVAYLATELELLVSSTYLARLRENHPTLIGAYDASFARYDYEFLDPAVAEIAAWSRVWTEGTFQPIYQARLQLRSGAVRDSFLTNLVRRHRVGTFALMLSLGLTFVDDSCSLTALYDQLVLDEALPSLLGGIEQQLAALWGWVSGDGYAEHGLPDAVFELDVIHCRRAS